MTFILVGKNFEKNFFQFSDMTSQLHDYYYKTFLLSAAALSRDWVRLY